MLEYGTKVVGGVSPGKAGMEVHGVPVFNTVEDAVKATDANTSIIYVPARFATDAIFEALDAGLDLVVCVTGGIPLYDEMKIHRKLKEVKSMLLGPNCPGVISPGKSKVGLLPDRCYARKPRSCLKKWNSNLSNLRKSNKSWYWTVNSSWNRWRSNAWIDFC